MKYDLFISHASEDKDQIVRPLAQKLENLGVNVWYDEFTLDFGSSISRSIELGLRDSKFGLLVLSENFINKNWPDIEYRALLSRHISEKHVILPLFYNISFDKLEKFSIFLKDIKGLNISKDNLNEIAIHILKKVRPDIYRKRMFEGEFNKLLQKAKPRIMDLDDIIPQKEPLSQLSQQQRLRCLNIYHGIGKLLNISPEEFVKGFEFDLLPEREIRIWELMNLCYLNAIELYPRASDDEKRDFFEIILAIGSGITHIKDTEISRLMASLWNHHFQLLNDLDDLTAESPS